MNQTSVKKLRTRIYTMLLPAALLFALFFPVSVQAAELPLAELTDVSGGAEASGDSFFITSYKITKSGKKKAVTNIQKGDTVDITLNMKNTSLLTDSFAMNDYDFSRLLDSFSGGKVSVSQLSAGKEPLILAVKISGLTYSGTGQSLKLQISRKGKAGFSQASEITVTEANVSEAPGQSGEQSPSPDPIVLISGSLPGAQVTAGQELEVTVNFQNLGDKTISSPVASFTPSEGLMLSGGAASVAVGDIPAKQTAGIRVKVKAFDSIPSPGQSLDVELKFNYDNDVTIAQGSASGRVPIPAKATGEQTDAEQADAPVPNIVIREFTYGEGSSVAAGSKFPLRFTFENTGKLKIENIVVTMDGGENLTVDGSTNTYFYETLAAGGRQTLEVPFQALAGAKSGAQNIDVAFKYEYVDHKKRAAANAEIKISVPVSQPDRFQVNAPSVPESVTAGEETVLSVDYVNKGQGDIANVEAVIEGEGVDSPARTQYLGNVAPGGSGTIGFALTPNAPGEIDVVLKVSYEDSDQQLKTKEFPVKLAAAEGIAEEEENWEEEPVEEQKGGFPWGVPAVFVLAAAVIVLIIRRKRKGKKEGASLFAEWEIEDEDMEG